MSSSLGRSMRYFSLQSLLSLRNIYVMFIVISGMQYLLTIYAKEVFMVVVASQITFGGAVGNTILFMQLQTITVPQLISFNAQRKGIYFSVLMQKILLSFVQSIVGVILLHKAAGVQNLQEILQIPQAQVVAAITLILFFLASMAEFFGCIQHKYGKWGTLLFWIFLIIFFVVTIMFVAGGVASAFNIGLIVKVMGLVFAVVSVMFCIASYRMVMLCEARG